MATNQDLSDAAWASWASNVITNHGSSLAVITSTNINSLAYTSTGGLVPGVNSAVVGTDFSVGSVQAVNDRNLGNFGLLAGLSNIKRNYP